MVPVLFLAVLVSLPAVDSALRFIPDDSSLRLELRDEHWFDGSADAVLQKKPFKRTLLGGGRVEVSSGCRDDQFWVVIARELQGSFPEWSQGSWSLVRNRTTGDIEYIRVFLRSDKYLYVQFRPFTGAEDKCFMDVVAYDAYIVSGLILPFSMKRLLVLPVEDVLKAAGTRFPRRYFEPNPDHYQDIRTFIKNVREHLPKLHFADDGGIDEQGRYVYIASQKPQPVDGGLNCSGFAKWLVDGILRPVTGTRLTIPPLKAPFGTRGSSFTNPYEASRDPFFGLDWTRNLAATVMRTLRSPEFGVLSEIEVQSTPFNRIIVRRSDKEAVVENYPNFIQDVGFSFEGLQPLLYTLAIDEPGYLYLASVNAKEGDPPLAHPPAGRPPLRMHFHVAALLPYFDEKGNFCVTVFESAAETSFASFKRVHQGRYVKQRSGQDLWIPPHFVNLVRIPIEGMFRP
ncbi:hypothetical protein FACS1894164_05270 [Spirochaetia bacterium]|nr:hypothetical protein FACS1894164_05270 [Spirochaetia bacterium]